MGLGLTFNPYLWSAVHYFRHNDAVLYNTPWMDLTVIPLGAREGLATGVFSPNDIEAPWLMRVTMGDAGMRGKALERVRFVVENHAGWAGLAGSDPVLPGWGCGEEQGWFAVCVR